jgi:hypothetical protein
MEPNSSTNVAVTIIARGGDIGSVRGLAGAVPAELDGSVAIVHVSPGSLHLQVRSVVSDSVCIALDGSVTGNEVVEIHFPTAETVDYRIVDLQGQPIRNVAVEFRRKTSLQQQLVSGTMLKSFVSHNLVRGRVDANGSGKATLPHGDYEIVLRNLGFRGKEVSWDPIRGANLSVPVAKSVEIVAKSTRKVVLKWPADTAVPANWMVFGLEDRFLGAGSGQVGVLWLDAGAHELSLRTDSGVVVGSAVVADSSGTAVATVVEVLRSSVRR